MTHDDLRSAQNNLRSYLTTLIRIEERLQNEGKSLNNIIPEAAPVPVKSQSPMTNKTSVIHINFPAAAYLFDARPIWAAMNNQPLAKEFGPQALSLATRGILMRTALQKLRLSLQELYALPDLVQGTHVIQGSEIERLKNDVLLYTDSVLFEFRSFLDLLATFTWGLLDRLGKPVSSSQTLSSGTKVILLDNSGKLRRHDYLLYLCDRLGLPTAWLKFLNQDRNHFTHEAAPYCAVEYSPGPPPQFEMLIMRTNIVDFATADPEDYFRVSELQSIVEGVAQIAPAVQAYIIGQL